MWFWHYRLLMAGAVGWTNGVFVPAGQGLSFGTTRLAWGGSFLAWGA